MKRLKWENIIPIIIPLAILLYVLYWNFLPFGYDQTFILDVGTDGDTDCSNPICITDLGGLGDIHRVGDKSWREFESKKAVELEIDYPINVDGKGVYVHPEFEFEGDGYIEYLFTKKFWNGEDYEDYKVWRPIAHKSWENYIEVGMSSGDEVIASPYKIYMNPLKYNSMCDDFVDFEVDTNKKEYELYLRGENKILAYFENGVDIELIGGAKGVLKKGNMTINSFSKDFKDEDLSGFFFIDVNGSLDKLKLNTNKFVMLNSINTSRWNKYYTVLVDTVNVSFLSDINQKVSFRNTPMMSLESKKKYVNQFDKGGYEINTEKGDLLISGIDTYKTKDNVFGYFNYLNCIKNKENTTQTKKQINSILDIPKGEMVYILADDVDYSKLVNYDNFTNTAESSLTKELNGGRVRRFYAILKDNLLFKANVLSESNVTFNIYDIDGDLLKSEEYENNIYYIDNEIEKGMYILEIKSDDNFDASNITINTNKFCYLVKDQYTEFECRYGNDDIFAYEIGYKDFDYYIVGSSEFNTIRSTDLDLNRMNITIRK